MLARRWFYVFLVAHLIAWTLVPALVRFNLPLDAIEGTLWGHQLEWGYDKNPYLNAWLTALATYLDGKSGIAIYLFSQLSVVACFWAVWQLTKRILSSSYALIAVLLLESIQYYNFHSIDFNDNNLELSLWALTTYYVYQATTLKRYRDWILTGLFAGLGMMAKYYTGVLLACVFLFLLREKSTRKQLTTLPPYCGLLIFLILIVPHVIWLFFHDFVTITYVFDRASNTPSWLNHFFFPLQFAWQQLEVFIPALILVGIFFLNKNKDYRIPLTEFNKRFLLYVGLGPFFLTLLLSFIGGITLRAGWGMPLLSWWGTILIAYLQPIITIKRMHQFIAASFLLMGLLLAGYSTSLIYPTSPSSSNFPGREIANAITQLWHDRYHTELKYVAGSRWIGGNISFYSPDHPSVFIEWNPKHAPWIDVKKMQQHGAVFVWDITDKETLPESVKKQFPQLKTVMVLEFNWHRQSPNFERVKVGVAILPAGL